MHTVSVAHTPTPPTVLVVDDNAAGRYSTSRALQAAGFSTMESSGGAAALKLAQHGVSAVVLDVHLPDVSGFEVCRLLRTDPLTAHLPVVHVSAVHRTPEDQVNGLTRGADAYFVAPVEGDVLAAMLNRLIGKAPQPVAPEHEERRYRGIFERAHSPIALVHETGRLIDVNPAFAQALGMEPGRLTGRALQGLAPKQWRSRIDAAVAGWKNPPWKGTFPLVSAEGNRVELSWNVTGHLEPGLFVAIAQPI